MPELHVRAGPSRARSIAFERTAIIGRGRGVDLSLGDRGVSTRHALLRASGDEYFVVDLGSQNGTFVNQRRVEQPMRLHDGDLLRLGDSVVEFRAGAGPERHDDTTAIRYLDAPASHTQVLLALPAGRAQSDLAGEPADPGARRAIARHAAFLDALARLLVKSLDPIDLLPPVVDSLADYLPQADRVFVLLGSGRADDMRVEASRVRQGPAEVVVSRTLLERVLERREGLLFTDMQVEGSLAASESIRGARLRSAISVPMVFDDTIYGVVQIDSLRTVAAFSQTDMRMVTVVATQLASALAYSRLHRAQLAQRMLEHDLALARRVQHQFLLAVPPEIPGHDTAVEYRPALAVGGDFYAVLPMDRGRYGLVVGDVSGKGVSAALYAAGLLADLRGLASACADPARLLGELNRKLSSGDREGMFATVALAVLEPGTGELGLSTAGHPLPLVRGPDAAVHTIGRRGSPPLGIDEDAAFDSLRFALEAGDTLVLFTDGISEATDRDHQLFGIERLEASVAAAPGDAAGVRATVLEALGAFCGDSPQADDLTLVAVSREP